MSLEKFNEQEGMSVVLSAVSTGSILTMKICWKIEHFSFRQHQTAAMSSPTIKCAELGMGDIEGDWCLMLIPKILSKRDTEEKEKEFVSLHLKRETKGGDIPTRFCLRIVDDQQNCVYRRDCMKPVIFAPKTVGSAMWGWDRYVSHEELFSGKNNKYLYEDALYLEAQIQCLASTGTVQEMSVSEPARDMATLTTDFGKMYTDSEFTDFTLVASDGRRLRAHRAVLVARSEVFRSMITHDTKESLERVCEINDTDGETLHALLTYMYSCSMTGVETAEKLAEKLLVAADKYCVKGLVRACELLLITKVNAHNSARLLMLADMHSAGELKSAVLRFVARNLTEVTNCGGMKDLANCQPGIFDEVVTFVGVSGHLHQQDKGTPSKLK